ncbi:hypothetical protein BDR03DRAFT_1010861 [Suillus americanus]|nr:hypothetical protein BDR03DRAFT_1010861 [Suillus americanus]
METVWNVYVECPPELELQDYFAWTNLIRQIQFYSEDYGIGSVQSDERQFMCVGCKSFDHATGLCPYPKIPGWFGPSAIIDPRTPPKEEEDEEVGAGVETEDEAMHKPK